MHIELNQEQASAVFILAVGELRAMKSEELDGETIDQHEIDVMYQLASLTNPVPSQPVPPWFDLAPLPDEDEGEEGETFIPQVV